jgi:hypothetical protein
MNKFNSLGILRDIHIVILIKEVTKVFKIKIVYGLVKNSSLKAIKL